MRTTPTSKQFVIGRKWSAGSSLLRCGSAMVSPDVSLLHSLGDEEMGTVGTGELQLSKLLVFQLPIGPTFTAGIVELIHVLSETVLHGVVEVTLEAVKVGEA